jgi:plastocyanin
MLFNYHQVIDLIQLVIVAPIMWTLATNQFPEEYKKYVLWLVGLLVLLYLYKIVVDRRMEGMQSVYGSNINYVNIFDAYPGYDKQYLTVKAGDSVVWTNVGEVDHTISAVNGEFNSGVLRPGQTFSVQFNTPGTFAYSCMFHSGWMHGMVEVV